VTGSLPRWNEVVSGLELDTILSETFTVVFSSDRRKFACISASIMVLGGLEVLPHREDSAWGFKPDMMTAWT